MIAKVGNHDSTRIAHDVVNLAPATGHLLENQQSISIEASLSGKYFAHTIAVKIQLLDVIDAVKKLFRRRLIALELHKVRDELITLRFGDEKQIALELIFRGQTKAAD